MTLTGIKTKSILRGSIAVAGPWQALFARSGYRAYPYQPGCAIRADSTGTTLSTHGLGEFVQNDYAMLCTKTAYGNGSLYIPDVTKITRVTSDPSAAADDTLTINPAISVNEDDWLLNLGADGAATPTSAPDYDGSTIQIYDDPVGNANAANPYLLTGRGGLFRGWIEDGFPVLDLLITDNSGTPVLVFPTFEPGPALAEIGTFTDADATPSIAGKKVWKTANTGATTITDFDGGIEGDVIRVLINDANTTIDFTGTNLKGNGGVDWTPASGDSMICYYDGTSWWCVGPQQ